MARTQQHKLETVLSVKDKASAPTKAVAKEMKFLGAASLGATGGLTAMVGQFGKLTPKLAIAAAGLIVAKKAVDTLKESLKEVSRSAAKFETEVSKIGTLFSGDIQKRMGEMSEAILQLGQTWGFTHQELAKVSYDIISASMADNAEQARKLTQQVAALALAGQGELQPTFNLLTFTMRAYGIEADHAGYVTAKLNNAVRQGKVTIQTLADPVSKVASNAAALSINLDNLLATFSTVSSAGNLDELGTQFDAFLRSITKPQGLLKQAFEDLGITDVKRFIYEAGGDIRVLLTTLSDYAQKEGLYIAELFTEARARRFVQKAATEDFLGRYGEYLESVNQEQGQFIESIDVMRQSAEHGWGQVTNIFNELKIRIGYELLPYIKEAAQFLLEFGKALFEAFGLAGNTAEKSAKDFSGLISTISTVMEVISAFIGVMRIWFGALGTYYFGVAEAIITVVDVVAAATSKITGLFARLAESPLGNLMPEWMKGGISGIDDFTNDISKSTRKLRDLVHEGRDFAVDQVTNAIGDHKKVVGALNTAKDALANKKTAKDLFDASEFATPQITAPDLIPEADRAVDDEAGGGTGGGASARGLSDPNLLLNVMLYQNDLTAMTNSILLNILAVSGGKYNANIGSFEFNLQAGVPNL